MHAFILNIFTPAVVRYARSFDVVVYTVSVIVQIIGQDKDCYTGNHEKGALAMLQFFIEAAFGLDSLNTKLHATN